MVQARVGQAGLQVIEMSTTWRFTSRCSSNIPFAGAALQGNLLVCSLHVVRNMAKLRCLSLAAFPDWHGMLRSSSTHLQPCQASTLVGPLQLPSSTVLCLAALWHCSRLFHASTATLGAAALWRCCCLCSVVDAAPETRRSLDAGNGLPAAALLRAPCEGPAGAAWLHAWAVQAGCCICLIGRALLAMDATCIAR